MSFNVAGQSQDHENGDDASVHVVEQSLWLRMASKDNTQNKIQFSQISCFS